MIIPQTRAELALMIPSKGAMIELGVAAGDFARQCLEIAPSITYIGIDRWSDHHDLAEMAKAQAIVKSERGWLLRETFANAADQFPDEFAHLIYIDGYAHTGQDNGQTLDDWWPKVRKGGIFAGHDYCKEYQPTIDAVNRFAAKHGIAINVINDGRHPSWWLKKDSDHEQKK